MRIAGALGSTLLAGLAAGVAAEQHNAKRDITYVTLTDVVWEIVTVTVYGDAPMQTTTLPALSAADIAVVAAATTPAAPLVAIPTTTADAPQQVVAPVPTSTLITAAAPAAVVDTPTTQLPAVVAPTTTTTPAAAVVAATPAAAAPAAAQQDSAITVGTYSGQGTFYELGLVACGQYYTDADAVAAISYKLFDQNGTPNPNNNPHCNQRIRVFRGSKHVDVAIVDRCAGCEGTYDVDLSPTAFDKLADESEGRVGITWSYL